MIQFTNVEKIYGSKPALSVNALTIKEKEFVGLVGNNGAGKTTMLSLILDLIKATKGLVKSKDIDVAKSESWKTYTGSYLNEGFLIPFLTPHEFLSYIGGLHGLNKQDIADFFTANTAFFDEKTEGNKYIRSLSLGNKNKIGILAAILSHPEILILDEPFANLDPTSQSWLKRKLTELNNNGTTIIISSHDLNHVTDVCQRILLIEKGTIIKDVETNTETLSLLEEHFEL